MARLSFVQEKFTPQATGREAIIGDGVSQGSFFNAISRPIFSTTSDGTFSDDLMPSDFTDVPEDLRSFLATERAFVPGGMRVPIKLGLTANWLKNDDVRDIALDLMANRGWDVALETISLGTETADQLFGKRELTAYYGTFPNVYRRPDGRGRPASEERPRDWANKWNPHCQRLKRVVQLITLFEATLQWRFDHGEGFNRFQELTGKPKELASADQIWDMMWIEPVTYSLSVLPRGAADDIDAAAIDIDVCPIVEGAEYGGRFTEETGQERGALFWILMGVPGRHETVQAAARACNRYYGDGIAQTQVVTVNPSDFGRLSKRARFLRDQHPDYAREPEYMVSIGPDFFTENGLNGKPQVLE